MSETTLSIQLLLNDQDALLKLQQGLDKVNMQSKQSTDSMNLGWAALAAQFYLVQQVLGPVINFMEDAVQAAVRHEDAVRRLNFALELQGSDAANVTTQYVAMAEQMRQTTRYSQDEILETMQTLTTIGNVGPDQIQRVTKAVMDLATATGRDLNSVSLALAKAAEGNITALKRFGIVLDDNIPKSQMFADALEKIEKKAGGMAEADIDSTGGAIARLGNSWKEVMIQIGELITQSPNGKAALAGLNDEAEKLNTTLGKIKQNDIRGVLQDLFKDSFTNFFSNLKGLASNEMDMAKSMISMIYGTPAQNQQDAEKLYALSAKMASDTMKQREAFDGPDAYQRGVNALFSAEKMKLDNVVKTTNLMKAVEDQKTLAFIADQKKELQAEIDSGTLSVQEKTNDVKLLAALDEASFNYKLAIIKAEQKAEMEKYQGQFEMAQAVANLSGALATATGSSALAGMKIVLESAVAAAKAIIAIQTAVDPFHAFIAAAELATVIVSAANAFAQMDAAQNALKASQSQSIQAVTNVPGLAGGGNVVSGGWTMVGENGPEMLNLPTGSTVTPLSGMGAQQITVNIYNPIFSTDNLLDQLAKSLLPILGPMLSAWMDNERRRL
jgi:Prophage tail length tape measure protein